MGAIAGTRQCPKFYKGLEEELVESTDWPKNKGSGNVSSCALGEVKQKYHEVSNLCDPGIQGVEDIQGLAMVVMQ